MKFSIFFLLSFGSSLAFGASVKEHKDTVGSVKENPRLMLSSYIKSGKIEEAREASIIKWSRESLDAVPSYTGFLTVNETTNSNLFFWFVPAMVEDPEDSPTILWLNGGPGTSSLFGFFAENGPFKVKKRGRIPKLVLRVRKDTWARKHNMLYIDSPVGTGFSFTDNEGGYSKSQDDIAQNLFSGLKQFYQLFPEYSKQDLYLAGESYAAKTIPHLGVHIHSENLKENATKINLKGLIMGGPMTDPASLTNHYADYYYNLGLIDESAYKYMKEQQEIATKLAFTKSSEAHKVKDELLFSQFSGQPSYFANVTGYNYFATALETRSHKKRYYFTQFLNQTSTRKLIHVGDQPFVNVSSVALKHLEHDIETSYKSDLEKLLNHQKYKVLVYVGQMDVVTPHLGVYDFVKSLDYEGKSGFAEAERKILRDRKRGDVSGYIKSHGMLSYVLVRNAGHYAPKDEPRWCREIVENFTSGKMTTDDF